MEWCEWPKHSFSISQNLQKIIRISSKITSPRANENIPKNMFTEQINYNSPA